MLAPQLRQLSIKGLSIAIIVILSWAISLITFLNLGINALPPLLLAAAVLWQTFLYTGLFIIAHDAMHNTVFPLNRKINNFIGSAAVFLYALFSFSRLLEKHWAHHRNPAREDDPDFHDGKHRGFVRWYLHFMVSYVTWRQLLGMAIAYNLLHFVFGIPAADLLVLWVLPSLLSTVQLFYFGTYLPHREEEGYADEHHARSNNYSVIWSFLTCYHFGYHWEHHEFPYLPWWKLPAARQKLQDSAKGKSGVSVNN
ncbi:MAG: fatty acid desaturase [Calditrichia bacterium]